MIHFSLQIAYFMCFEVSLIRFYVSLCSVFGAFNVQYNEDITRHKDGLKSE
jgi:hypothetical protein